MLRLMLILLLAAPVLWAQEKIVLTSPPPSVTEYRVVEITMSWRPTDECVIAIQLAPNVAGPEMRHRYYGESACQMIRALNTANLSAISLQRRIMNQLLTDKVLVGSVTGTPEAP